MKPMLNSKPPWHALLFTRENLKKALKWLAVLALVAWLAWPDSREKKLIREVNEKTAMLIQKFPTLTDEQIVAELEAIKLLTDEPEPEPEDPY